MGLTGHRRSDSIPLLTLAVKSAALSVMFSWVTGSGGSQHSVVRTHKQPTRQRAEASQQQPAPLVSHLSEPPWNWIL